MASLVHSSYFLNDWDRIQDTFTKYIANHKQQIKCLEEWIAKEPHMPNLPRNSLALILHLSHESVEAAKEMADAYFTHKTRHPEMYTKRCADIKRTERTLDLVEVAAIEPWVTSLDGARLAYIRLVDTDASKLDFHLAMQTFMAALDYEMARVGVYIKGLRVMLDMTGFHLGILQKLNIADAAVTLKYMTMFEKIIVGVHVINCTPHISQIMTVIKPFLSKGIASKMHFHTSNQMDEFYKIVPREYVPSTYGGSLESMTELNAQFRKRFQGAEDWLRQTEGADWQVKDNLRRTQTGQEEMKGSFRRLCID